MGEESRKKMPDERKKKVVEEDDEYHKVFQTNQEKSLQEIQCIGMQ